MDFVIPLRIFGRLEQRCVSIDANGITEDWVKEDLFSGFSADFITVGSRVYATSGAVLDPEVPKLLGSFPASGAIAVDPELSEVYTQSRVARSTSTTRALSLSSACSP